MFDLASCRGSLTRLGQGCADSGGTVMQMGWSGCANLGESVVLRAGSTDDNLGVLFVAGLSDTTGQGLPLPADLALFGGVNGCFIFTSSDAVLATPNLGGTAQLSVALPANLALAGVQTFWQALKIDPSLAASLKIATSDYLRMVVR